MVFSACRIWTLFTCYLHMYTSSTHYLGICILCTHYLQWSLISSLISSTDAHCPCYLHVVHTYTHHLLFIFNTPCIPYYPQLSFCTLSTHMHIVHVICMLSTHVHIICLSSLTLLVYPIIHNLVSVHIVSTHTHCQYHAYIVSRCICAYVMYISFLLLLFAYVYVICILSEHMHIMHTLSAVVLDIFLPNRQC